MSTDSLVMPKNFTRRILLALAFGAITGIIIKLANPPELFNAIVVNGALHIGGRIFVQLLQMLVVPVVFVSLTCGVSSLNNVTTLGRIGFKTLGWYLLTTLLALVLGISFSLFFGIGSGASLQSSHDVANIVPPQLKDTILNMIPSNPIAAMATGNLLQLIIFSILLGMAILMAGAHGQSIRKIFISANNVIEKLIYIVMLIAPYGIFFLLAELFARQGVETIIQLAQYFMMVFFVLLFHLFVTYSLFLKIIGRLNVRLFFKNMYSAMLFAFSVSSSNASIPVVMETVEKKLGVDNSVASFVVPLGATMNMDGTAIMQSVATIFIAHAYQIDIGMSGYLTVILMATLASIGTAGVPSVGLITLTMVLQQVGLPIEGIALIIGIDRLLDMLRTAVNISGDAMISCLVARSEGLLDLQVYNKSGGV